MHPTGRFGVGPRPPGLYTVSHAYPHPRRQFSRRGDPGARGAGTASGRAWRVARGAPAARLQRRADGVLAARRCGHPLHRPHDRWPGDGEPAGALPRHRARRDRCVHSIPSRGVSTSSAESRGHFQRAVRKADDWHMSTYARACRTRGTFGAPDTSQPRQRISACHAVHRSRGTRTARACCRSERSRRRSPRRWIPGERRVGERRYPRRHGDLLRGQEIVDVMFGDRLHARALTRGAGRRRDVGCAKEVRDGIVAIGRARHRDAARPGLGACRVCQTRPNRAARSAARGGPSSRSRCCTRSGRASETCS